MASAVIHIAVASEINNVIKRDKYKLLIGSIAPDISKQIGETKIKSHFLDNENNDIPNIDKFLGKYKDNIKSFINLSVDLVLSYLEELYVV